MVLYVDGERLCGITTSTEAGLFVNPTYRWTYSSGSSSVSLEPGEHTLKWVVESCHGGTEEPFKAAISNLLIPVEAIGAVGNENICTTKSYFVDSTLVHKNIKQTTADLSVEKVDVNEDVEYSFMYCMGQMNYDRETVEKSPNASVAVVPAKVEGNKLSSQLTGLTNGTLYVYDVVARVGGNIVQTVYGGYFSTLPVKVNISTTNISQTTATVQVTTEAGNAAISDMQYRLNDGAWQTLPEGDISLEDLTPNTQYTFSVQWMVDNMLNTKSITFKTSAVTVLLAASDVTQTTATINVDIYAGTASVSNVQYSLGSSGYRKSLSEDNIVLTGLTPSKEYTLYLYWAENGTTYTKSTTFKTSSITIYAGSVKPEQTSASVRMGSYELGTSELYASGVIVDDVEYLASAGEHVRLTDLKPNTKYSITYIVVTKEGGIATCSANFNTTSISTVTKQVSYVSNRSATLNGTIECDAYSGAEFGFQWKTKQNWTTDPRFTKGRRNDDGTISVSLVNGMLNPDTEYQFRTAVRYGKNSDGTDVYYYGEWRDFRTELEFVIYPATPYTMYRTDSENNRLVLCGYYVAGSEDIVSQGYEYWRGGSANAKGVASSYATAAEKNVITTDGSMEASIDLSTLDAGTYVVQAFVKTATATYYGQQLSFSVGTPDAIEGVYGEEPVCMTSHNAIVLRNAENLHVRIADMAGRTLYSGRCESNMETYSVPGGIYIVQFGTGCSKKVLVK